MPVGALDNMLAEHAGENLVLVGHQPSMGAMAAHLLGIATLPRQVSPGTVIGLELPDGGPGTPARLLFFSAPGQTLVETLSPP
jgi:phosphohistidine phosphatase